ncbi:hypothetical protein A3A66_00640 [Microgenomates group bacterium RIFCSPLOWO2_01_FULL_46_13]|nr:MAG: hypothetical protein A3A66_00640 [Microgenomates group bacterium RIFCSPLOWO2_01_FULL_46_13]
MRVLIVIPAYNEEEVISQVIVDVRQQLKTADILVVDDGSTDQTGEEAFKAGAAVVRHVINRGLGGAIGTGIEYSRGKDYTAVATIDADGQHDANDLLKVLQPIFEGRADVVIGSRLLQDVFQVPIDRRLLIRLSNLLTFILFGFKSTDTLSGFRAFSRKALEKIELKTETMEVSNELFGEISRHQLRYLEVPIRVRYTPYSRTKGQTNLNALNVGIKLLLRLAR